MIAGTLEVQMLASLARLSSDMQQAKSIVGGAAKHIETAVAGATRALGALGIGLGVGVFAAFIKGSIDAMDALEDLEKQTGLTIETLSGLSFAAKIGGADLTSTADAIGKLSVNIGKDTEKFRALGITAKDPLEAFKQLADLYSQLEDPQQRAATMAAALGKSWAGAAPLLAEGSEKIQELVDKGTKLSGVTKEGVAQASAFNDALDEMLAASKGAGVSIATALLPHLLTGIKLLAEFKGNTDLTKIAVDAVIIPLKVAAGGFIALAGAVAAASRAFITQFAVADKLKNLDFKGAWDEFNIGMSESKALLDATASTVSALWQKHEEGAKKAADTTGKVDQATKDAAAARAKAFLAEKKTVEDIDSTYRNLLKTLKEKLAATEELSEVERLHLTIEAMSAKQLQAITPARKAELEDLARKIDLKKQEKVALDAYVKAMEMDRDLEEEIAALLAARATKEGEAIKAQHEALEQIGFETKLMTLNNAEREKAIALRALEKSGIDKFSAEYERLAIAFRVAIDQRVALQEAVEQQQKATEEITEFWRQAARNMQDAMADFFFDAMQGKLDDLAGNFKRTLDRMVANALAANLADAIFGKDFGRGSNGIGGLLGGLLDKIGLGEAAGRAPVTDAILSPNIVMDEFATGTDFVPRTGNYRLHEGEAVLTKEENARGGRIPPSIVFNVQTPNPDGFRLARRQIMGELAAL